MNCQGVGCDASYSCTGKYHCPVTYKVFNENSHIVAVRTTGNVYSYDVSEVRLFRANV